MSGIDYEVRTRFHPEPPTAEEQEGMARVDPTMAGIFAHKLLTIASEGNELVIKLGASTGCRWGDTAVAIYTALRAPMHPAPPASSFMRCSGPSR